MLITSIHCLYTGNTCTYNVNTCQIQGMYMFYNLHTVRKHHIYIIYRPLVRLSQSGTHVYNANYHIYNASCQESSILCIDCVDLTHTCWNFFDGGQSRQRQQVHISFACLSHIYSSLLYHNLLYLFYLVRIVWCCA